MAYAERHNVTIATAADGTATGYTPVINGKILNIIYTKAASGNYDDGVDFAIIAETTGIGLWTEANVNATKTVCPKQPTHTQVGVANATAGDVLLADIFLANERVKISIAEGGNVKTGTFTVIVGG